MAERDSGVAAARTSQDVGLRVGTFHGTCNACAVLFCREGDDYSAVAAFRRDNLGFVFQEFNLLDTFTLEDNIYLPLVLAGRSWREMDARLAPIARTLGIQNILKKYPYEVSGGQKQRAAVARGDDGCSHDACLRKNCNR